MPYLTIFIGGLAGASDAGHHTGSNPAVVLSSVLGPPGYQSGVPFPSLGDLPNPGIKPGSSALQADSLPSELLRTSLVARYSILTI